MLELKCFIGNQEKKISKLCKCSKIPNSSRTNMLNLLKRRHNPFHSKQSLRKVTWKCYKNLVSFFKIFFPFWKGLKISKFPLILLWHPWTGPKGVLVAWSIDRALRFIYFFTSYWSHLLSCATISTQVIEYSNITQPESTCIICFFSPSHVWINGCFGSPGPLVFQPLV